MTTVKKIDGAPGTGKTTAIFNAIEELDDDGVDYDDVLVVTFTRSARRDASEELQDVFPLVDPHDVDDRVRTFHGAALVAAIVGGAVVDPSQQLIVRDSTPHIYARFCRRQALPFEPDEDPTWDEIRSGNMGDLPSGNKLFKTADWLALTQRPYEDHPRAPTSPNLGYERVVELLEAWDEFKAEGTEFEDHNGNMVQEPFVEHHDYVDAAIERGLVPNGRYLFADEFQDLSPQEYRLFKTWRDSGQFETITAAGDPEQSIYGFREASSYFFEEMPADDVQTLKTSYRCPSEITGVASGILDDHPRTDPRGFNAASAGGEVHEKNVRADSDLRGTVIDALAAYGPDNNPADIFILVRANHQAFSIGSAFEGLGIPYQMFGGYSRWTETLGTIHSTLRAIEHNHHATVNMVATLLDVMPVATRERYAKRFDEQRALLPGIEYDKDEYNLIPPEEIEQAFTEPTANIVDELSEVSRDRREILRNVVTHDEIAEHSPTNVTVGTIHKAKGLEADCVILCPEITPRVEEGYYEDEDTAAEEHRLFYVGASRAREGLIIMRDYCRGPVFPGLRDQVPGVAR